LGGLQSLQVFKIQDGGLAGKQSRHVAMHMHKVSCGSCGTKPKSVRHDGDVINSGWQFRLRGARLALTGFDRRVRTGSVRQRYGGSATGAQCNGGSATKKARV